ncbi:phosphotransferase family protein [Lacticaseibacillus parakribbianus]|uniref:phosphotransferase family protein n=1 Tax=Lacticaseibacillus parakribbianus TaxID=2970927 RepID=UPI0021CB1BEC|nr:aminoglycoside phosphotransferase family protein [Lacticaseibacillus parakribbianus]
MPSRIYQELTPPQLTALIRRHFPGATGYRVAVAHGGLFNTTYRLTLATGAAYILRIGPVHRELLLPFEHGLMAADAQVADLLAQHGVPGSQVVAWSPRDAALDRAYMLTRCLPGVTLNDPAVTPSERLALYRQLGATMAAFHAITAPRFGRLAEPDRRFATWSGWVEAEFATTLALLVHHALLTPAQAAHVQAWVAATRPALDAITTPHLVHADLWEGNVLVSLDHRRLVAIIDCDRGLFGDPALDFAISPTTPAEFYEGYGRRPAPDAAATTRDTVYRALYSAWDGFVYAVEYANPQAAAECLARLVALAAG